MAILLMSASGGKASKGAEVQVKERQPVPRSPSNCWIKLGSYPHDHPPTLPASTGQRNTRVPLVSCPVHMHVQGA